MLLLVYKCGHMAANCEIGLTCKCGTSSYPTINLIYIKTGKKGNLLVDTLCKIPQVYHVHRRTIIMKDKRPSCEKKDDPMVMSVLLQFRIRLPIPTLLQDKNGKNVGDSQALKVSRNQAIKHYFYVVV